TTSGGTPGYTYTWTLPSGCTGSSTTSSISVTCSPNGSYTISVVAKDANNVSSASASTLVTVGAGIVNTTAPTCGAATSGKAFSCPPTTTGGVGPYTYTWTLPAACTGTSTTSSISVTCSPKGSYSISVVAKDTQNVSSASASSTVVVAGQPVVTTAPSCASATV